MKRHWHARRRRRGVDPTLLTRLVEPEYDADGQPSNVGAAVAAVLEAYPQLKPQAPTGNATNPGRVAKLSRRTIFAR